MPWKKATGASESLGVTGTLAGANTPMPNPVGGVQNAQMAYHMHQFGKIRMNGMKQALGHEEKAKQAQREKQSAQVHAAGMKYGENGITAANGYFQDKGGKIVYRGKK